MNLADNVAVFRPDSNERIKSVLKKAGLEALLKDKSIDLNTVLSKEFAKGCLYLNSGWSKKRFLLQLKYFSEQKYFW